MTIKNQPFIKKPKSKAGTREVPIPNFLVDVLHELSHDYSLVCPDVKGQLMSKRHFVVHGIATAIISILARVEEVLLGRVKRFKLLIISRRILRHTYASMPYEAGVDIKSAQRFLVMLILR